MTDATSDDRIRLAVAADADRIGELLDRFNTEFGEPTPGAEAVAARVRQLMESGDLTRGHSAARTIRATVREIEAELEQELGRAQFDRLPRAADRAQRQQHRPGIPRGTTNHAALTRAFRASV